MQLDSARDLKSQLQSELVVAQPLVMYSSPPLQVSMAEAVDAPASLQFALTAFERELSTTQTKKPIRRATLPAATPALGIAPGEKVGAYKIAVRIQEPIGTGPLVEYFSEQARGEIDVRLVPRALAQLTPQDRHRPVRSGISIGHPMVTAGTLCCFVESAEGAVMVLSANHVIAAANQGRSGDPVFQPGPSDGKDPASDRIGSLDAFVPLVSGSANRVDAAVCTLDAGIDHQPTTGRTVVDDLTVSEIVKVQKDGRTTGRTVGRISSYELDGLLLEVPDFGFAEFDGLVEFDGGSQAFSLGGDSGALVTDESGQACLAMVIGGDNEQFSWGTPLNDVLGTLGVSLLG